MHYLPHAKRGHRWDAPFRDMQTFARSSRHSIPLYLEVSSPTPVMTSSTRSMPVFALASPRPRAEHLTRQGSVGRFYSPRKSLDISRMLLGQSKYKGGTRCPSSGASPAWRRREDTDGQASYGLGTGIMVKTNPFILWQGNLFYFYMLFMYNNFILFSLTFFFFGSLDLIFFPGLACNLHWSLWPAIWSRLMRKESSLIHCVS